MSTKAQYVTVGEAATLLGYTTQHTRLLIREGKLPATKVGRDWILDRQVLIEHAQDKERVNKGGIMREPMGVYITATGRRDESWGNICERADYSSAVYALYEGEAQNVLRSLPEESIDTGLTSPPYWRARDYEHDEQIGLEPEPDVYVSKIVSVLSEVRRVLRPDGSFWLNIGDCYLNGGYSNGRGWQRSKQLTLMPFRVALALQDDGWFVRNTLVWHKPNAMPASVRDRLSNTWEPVFLLTKSAEYHFDLDPIRVPHKTSDIIERRRAERALTVGKASGNGDLRRWLTSPRHRATIDGIKEVRRRPSAPEATELAAYLRQALEKQRLSIGWIADQLSEPFERVRHYFRVDKVGSRLPPEETWPKLKKLLHLDSSFDSAMAVEVGDNVFRNHPNGRNPGDLQSFSLRGSDVGHFATMPLPLASWCLKATLPPGGVCLDPFMGVGTTGLGALNLGGRFVGIDLRGDFVQVARDSLDHGRKIIRSSLPA